MELDVCKQKLIQYEAYERERSMNFFDFYSHVKDDIQHLQERLLAQIAEISQRGEFNMQRISPYIKEKFEERRKAIEIMAETMIQISLPFSHRYLLYVAENDPEGKALQEIPMVLGSKEGGWDAVVKQLKFDGIELMKVKENRSFLQNSALNLRKNVQKFYACQKRIQDLVTEIDMFLVERLMPKVTGNTFTNYVKWVQKVRKCRISGRSVWNKGSRSGSRSLGV